MNDSEAIEAVARALCVESGDDPATATYAHEMKCAGSDREPREKWEYWKPFAKAAIAAMNKFIPVLGAESASGAHVAVRTGCANHPTGAEPCPYAIDGCVLENGEIGPCLCVNPIDRAPVAWVEFTERGAIRFWTNDPERAAHESQKRTMTEFSLSSLVALLGKQPSPVALMHIGKIDSIACSYAYCDDASLHTDMRHIHELATLARDVFYTSRAVAETDADAQRDDGLLRDSLLNNTESGER